jgi:hypothetical protein
VSRALAQVRARAMDLHRKLDEVHRRLLATPPSAVAWRAPRARLAHARTTARALAAAAETLVCSSHTRANAATTRAGRTCWRSSA